MPIDLKILDEGVGVHYIFTGLVTGKELIELNTALYASGAQLQKIRYAIVDESGMDSLDMSFAELKKIELLDKQAALLNPDIVVALVVDKDLPLNITRAWEARTHDLPWDRRIFASGEAACAWLREKVSERFGTDVTLSAM